MSVLFQLLISAISTYGFAFDTEQAAKLDRSVFQLSTSLTADTDKSSYGTAFVVRKDGVLATNFHVVAAHIHSPRTNKLFIEVAKSKFEAKVIAVDIANDLALIKVDMPFSNPLTVKSNLPKQGSRVLSLGFPVGLGFSVIEGLTNRIVTLSPYQLLHLSIPLNAGMSGGPILNSKGDVIAINDAILPGAENIGFAIPAKALLRLLKETKLQSRMPAAETFLPQINSQLISIQEELTKQVFEKQRGTFKLGNRTVKKLARALDCWAEQPSKVDSDHYTFQQKCMFKGRAFFSDEVYPGTFDAGYELIMNAKNNPFQFTRVLNWKYNFVDALSSNPYLSALFGDKKGYLSSPVCLSDKIRTTKKTLFTINLCLRAYTDMDKLYDADFKALAYSNNDEALILRSSLRGFTKENIWQIVRQMLESTEENHDLGKN